SRPAMAEDDGLSRAPVLVEYLGTVFGGDRGHGEPPSLTEILHRYSIIRVSCARPRYVPLAFDIRPISRMVEEVRRYFMSALPLRVQLVTATLLVVYRQGFRSQRSSAGVD